MFNAGDTESCCVEDDEYRLFLLKTGDVFTTAVLLQQGNHTTYISLIDSTGYARGTTYKYIQQIIKKMGGLIVCFSHPMPQPIFGESARNPQKRQLDSLCLFKYWSLIFEMRCSHRNEKCLDEPYASMFKNEFQTCFTSTWSNFSRNRKYPYSKLSKIEKFNDDPKSKMIHNFKNCRNMFEGLLMRSDFSNGGLLYSFCNHADTDSSTDNSILRRSVPKILEYLRSSDYSTSEHASASTQSLIAQFELKFERIAL
ncbi:hypothetical protein ENBRE01_0826 [Enteropsectra breve]|nr:hypothetical protein ENBRE01_0826 [Enteropsectra breve]